MSTKVLFGLGLGAVLLGSSLTRTAHAQQTIFKVGDDLIGRYAQARTPKPPCSASKMREVFAAATTDNPNVYLDCSLDLVDAPEITKTIVIEGDAGTDVVVNCNGNVLLPLEHVAVTIRSKRVGSTFEVPHHVTVKNCEVRGRIKVVGIDDAHDASRTMGATAYTVYAQQNGPHHVVLDTLDFETDENDPMYFYPGVTYNTLRNSVFAGTRSTPTIYLDAESGHNVIENNQFLSVNTDHQVIAIDGSAYNRIVGNYFAGLNRGGIYIYRNCGEIPPGETTGTVRVQEPRHNQIVNNVFYYKDYDGTLPAVWVGSRNHSSDGESFCGKDSGIPYGSGIDNHDLAYENVLAQNRFYKFTTAKIVKATYPYGSYLNEGPASSKTPRPSGCYVELWTGANVFLQDGESVGVMADAINGKRYLCQNGLLRASAPLQRTVTPFTCTRSSSDNGCVVSATCATGVKVATRIACNLELANLPSLATVGVNQLSVVRPSDVVSDGVCALKADGLTISASSGFKPTETLMGAGTSIQASCREHDVNGGDCAVNGELDCL